MREFVHLANNYVCDVVGVGDVEFKFPNGSSFTLKNVCHVPKLTKSLISTGQLDDLGYATTFGSQSWRILKGSLIIAQGAKCGTLYPLHVSSVLNHVIVVTKLSNTSLWHNWLSSFVLEGNGNVVSFGLLATLKIFIFFCL